MHNYISIEHIEQIKKRINEDYSQKMESSVTQLKSIYIKSLCSIKSVKMNDVLATFVFIRAQLQFIQYK